jgi:hypothetical protein
LEVARGGCRGGGAAGRLGDVVGEPFAVEGGTAEQELDVEERRSARADAVEPVVVLEFADDALGVRQPLLVRPAKRARSRSGSSPSPS